MIRQYLITALETTDVTLILYESRQLANVLTDQATKDDILAVIIEPDFVNLEAAGNGLQEHYQPTVVEIMKQVPAEELAATNEAVLIEVMAVAKAFILALMRGGSFQKIPNVPCTKITERRYDANVLGWSLALDLKPIENATTC